MKEIKKREKAAKDEKEGKFTDSKAKRKRDRKKEEKKKEEKESKDVTQVVPPVKCFGEEVKIFSKCFW